MIEYASYLLCTASIYFLYDQRPWKGSTGSKALTLVAFGLVFAPLFGGAATAISDLIWKPVMLAFIFGGMWYAINKLIKRFGLHSTKSADEFISGVRLGTVDEVNRIIKKIRGEVGPMIGGILLKLEFFSTHTLLIGSTGSGKSLILRLILEYICKKKHKCIMVDPGGEFLSHFYDPSRGDKILNPLDERSESWSLFAEMRSLSDAVALTNSMIPEGKGSGAQWNQYARTVMRGTIEQVYSGYSEWRDTDQKLHRDFWKGTNEELYKRLVIEANAFSMQRLNGSAAGKLMDGGDTMTSSFMAIIGQYCQILESLDPNAGKDSFSIKKWVEDDDQQGILWITYNFNDLAYLKPLISFFVDVASNSILSLPTKRDRNIWFIVDEFPVLGKVESVLPLLTNSRRKGGKVVLASQTFSQWESTYGKTDAVTFLGNMRMWAIFSSPELETRQYLSKSIGTQMVETKTYSGGSGKGAGWSKNVTERTVVTDSELKTLPPRHFFITLPGDIPVAKSIVELPPESYQPITEAIKYKNRDESSMPSVDEDDNSLSEFSKSLQAESYEDELLQELKNVVAVENTDQKVEEQKSSLDDDDLPFNLDEINKKDDIDIDSQTKLIDF